MRLNQNQMKMLVFMMWLVKSHRALLQEGEPEIPDENDADLNYNALYVCCKKTLENFGGIESIQECENYYSVAQKLNNQIERMKRDVGKRMGDNGCTLMMLIVGALRHCNLNNLKGAEFEELKSIDLDSIIAKAREEKYLNAWSVQSLCRGFKFGYWEA